MKRKRLAAILIASSLAATSLLGGCGSDGQKNEESQSTKSESGAEVTEVSHDEEMTLEIYDVAANYQGEQSGWFGKILKDKFNLKLNIIAPQVSGDGDSLYQTRSASGNLGDIVILDNSDMQDCIEAGLIMDIGDIIGNYENLSRYQEQINLFNGYLQNVDEGSVYAIPCNMNSNGPTAFTGENAGSAPRVPWDYFKEIGCPEMKTSDDLLKALADIQAAHPTNNEGDAAYAISMWKDWDGTSIANANEVAKWFGQEVRDSILIGADNSITALTDKEGAYYKALQFFYKANQMGIVDPDSATQDWTSANDKMKQKRVYLFWYNWQNPFWNSIDRGNAGENFMYTPVEELEIYQLSDSYYGDGRVWGVGSGVDDEKKARIMELLDWLASPEGLTYLHDGLEGLIYTVNEDGTYTLTKDGEVRFSADIQVPEEQGGGLWADGQCQINQWIVGSAEISPLTNEYYESGLWASTLKANETTTAKEWTEKYGAKNEVEYMNAQGQISMVPNNNVPLGSDTTDIALIRSQCGDLVSDTSWKMVYASDDAQFEQMWDDMTEQLEGLGWDQLVEYDTEKYQPLLDARTETLNSSQES